jgi:hypothetical protein
VTHLQVVTEAMRGATAADRLTALGGAVAKFFNGLTPGDGAALSREWRSALVELATCGDRQVQGWAAAFGESTGGWWPPDSSLICRGIVSAVVRSPLVEDLHTGDRVSFYDNQLGAMCANWAAVSLLDPLLGAETRDWGLTEEEHRRGPRTGLYSSAPDRFPAGWAVIESLGRCLTGPPTTVRLDLPTDGTADEAREWLVEHAGNARETDIETRVPGRSQAGKASARHAWSAPTEEELDGLATVDAIRTVGLTRLTRHPLHLAAMLQWAVRSGIGIHTPNAAIEPTAVALRWPLVPAPATHDLSDSSQASHHDSWTNPAGLTAMHAAALGVTSSGRKPGRNDPCPCGSGAKYKRCHGR